MTYWRALCAVCLLTACSDPAPTPVTGADGTSETDATTEVAGGDATVPDATDATDNGPGPVSSCFGMEDGVTCEDGDQCTIDDVCASGSCVGGANRVCDEEGLCREGTCTTEQGCVYADVANDHPCSVACFSAATCQSGGCEPDPDSKIVCPKSNEPCVVQLECEAATGQCTVPIFAAVGAECDSDGDVCTLELCEAGGVCTNDGALETCQQQQANNPCWTWTCTKKSGCVQTLFVEGVSCNDNNACTVNDSCLITELGQKACLGAPVDPDDGNPCTNDSCVQGEVIHEPIDGVSCDTDDPCSETGVCEAGKCVGATPCACEVDGDCKVEDPCLGTPLCDKESGPVAVCTVVPGTAVVCPPSGAPCLLSVCEAGLCTAPPAPSGGGLRQWRPLHHR